MHSITVLALVALASATKYLEARSMIYDLSARQIFTDFCGSVPADSPNPCEAACGAGSRQCGPAEENNCFRPQLGETCCVGNYACKAENRCTTDGCCRDDGNGGCEGKTFVSTLPGDGYSSTATPSASAPSATVSSSSISAPPAYSSASSSSSISVPPAVYTPPASGTGGNATMPTWYPPAQQTTNAGVKGEVAGWFVGGLAVLGIGYVV